MSEQIQEQPAAPAPVPCAITFEELKAKLVANFEMMYGQFCSQLGTIPCSPDNHYPAMRHFDDGFFNFREGIRRLRLEQMQPTTPSQEPAKQEAPATDVDMPPAA